MAVTLALGRAVELLGWKEKLKAIESAIRRVQKCKNFLRRRAESETQLVIAWFVLPFWGTGCLDILSWRGKLRPLIAHCFVVIGSM
jgi:hypothetical protein